MSIIDFDIESVLAKLAEKRPIFHSEADFQHALAWEVHLCNESAKIRIEKPYLVEGKLFYIDLIVEIDGKVIAIELKYKTKKVDNFNFNNEEFNLKNHGAQNWGRYHFINDIVRLEKLMNEHSIITESYAIFLTNDSSYKNSPKDKSTTDYSDFSLENKSLSGLLKWKDEKKVSKELKLKNSYTLNWKEYEANHHFKYLIVKVEN